MKKLVLKLLPLLFILYCEDIKDYKNNFSIFGLWSVTHIRDNNTWQELVVDYSNEIAYSFLDKSNELADSLCYKYQDFSATRNPYTFDDMVLYIKYPSPIKYDVENQSDSTMTWSIKSSNELIYKLKKVREILQVE